MNLKSRSTLEKYEKILRVKNYSERTVKIYSRHVFLFLCEYKEDVYHIPLKEVRRFLMEYKYSSISQQNHFIGSITLLYKYVVGLKLKDVVLERPRKEKRLPKVLSESEIVNGIKKCENIKHKAMLSMLFSTGMRRSELLNLKVKDIDSENMMIRIKMGKGFKDRNVPLTEPLLILLRKYYKEHKPKFFLFEGAKGKYSETSLANITKKYLKTNPHSIRHSRGTNLINTGADVTEVQKLFGHKNIKTTSVYIHTSVDNLRKLYDPLKQVI